MTARAAGRVGVGRVGTGPERGGGSSGRGVTDAERGATGAERGATSTELVVAFPAVLTIVLLAFQFGLYLHAAQIAEAAAQEAVEAAQGERATVADGGAAARELLADVGGLQAPRIDVERSATTASAHVAGSAQALLPGWPVAVSATAEGPVERFVPEGAP